MWGKNAAKFKQSISDIIESMSDEIYTNWYSHFMSVKSSYDLFRATRHKWYNSSSIDITIYELIKNTIQKYKNTKNFE